MTTEQYKRAVELYHAAMALTPDARADFLATASGNDNELRREVQSLLKAHDGAQGYFDATAIEVAAALLSQQHTPSLAGRRLSHYQVLDLIDAGGMGQVFLADDTRLGRKVAVKVLSEAFTTDTERIRRFEQEAKAASALNHPNIITIHEIGQADSAHYIVTEFVDGETLRQHMTRNKLDVGAALDIAAQIAGALAAAHAAGIVHRDIKPENVMVRPDGLIKVLDFGLAKLTERNATKVEMNGPDGNKSLSAPGQVMGTPAYMSPEQARGTGVDARSDIFSLGVVLYEMISGRRAFTGATSTDVIVSILQEEPAPLTRSRPEAPPELDQIIARALSKERESRYQNAAELLADLKRLKRSLELPTQPGHITQADKRLSWPWALVAAVVILFAVGGWLAHRTRETAATQETPVIAVLPFKNRSTDKDGEYFADGLTEELIHNLSLIEGLEVRSWTSSFAFKDKQHNLAEVATKLKANYVVDGSVLRSGGNLRVNTQLVRVSDEKALWTGRFENSEPKDIFKIQDEISLGITNQLRVKLGRGRRRYETSVDAYDLYLRAGGQSKTSVRPDIQQLDNTISLYEEVIEKDSSFAPAYAKLASLHAWRSAQFVIDDTEDSVRKGQVAAEKAIQLDPLLVDAHVALGWLRARKGEWGPAEGSFREAIRLNPGSSNAYTIYAYWMLTPIGRLDDALEQLRLAEIADPLSNEVMSTRGIVLLSLGRYDEAAEYLERSRDDSAPNESIRWARLRLGQKRVAEAIQLLENDPKRSNNPVIRGWLGNAYIHAGRRNEAEQMAAVSKFADERALIFAGLGDKGRTLEALENMASRGPQRVGRFLMYPEFAFLRGDPRVKALRERVGLPQQE